MKPRSDQDQKDTNKANKPENSTPKIPDLRQLLQELKELQRIEPNIRLHIRRIDPNINTKDPADNLNTPGKSATDCEQQSADEVEITRGKCQKR